jgi:hypothetical protein
MQENNWRNAVTSRHAILTVAALLALGASALTLARQDPSGQPLFVQPPESAESLQTRLIPSALAAVRGAATVLIGTSDKSLTLRWTYEVEGDLHAKSQKLPLSYWPTAAEAAGDQLYIAGKTSDRGRTIIDRWTLTFTNFPDDLPTVAVEQVYNDKQAGMREPRWMERMSTVPALPTRLLCQFGDSKDLGVFSSDTGAFTLALASGTFPALQSADHRLTWAGLHQQLGAFYVWQRKTESTTVDPILFFDSDQDGVLDVWLQCTDQAFWDSLMGEPKVDWTALD